MRQTTTPSFLTFLKAVENSQLLKTGDPQYIQHDSPEGGLNTIGYGHKLDVIEQQTGMIQGYLIEELTEPQCVCILHADLSRCESQLEQFVTSWPTRSQRTREMLLGFQFNLGNVMRIFPKFFAAALAGDIETQRKEYKRYYTAPDGHIRPLKQRNRLFYSRYLSPAVIEGWGAP